MKSVNRSVYPYMKRGVDIILSFFAILLLFPVMLVIGIIVKASSKGPVFFTQKRMGKDDRIFTILKFRSMYIETPRDVATSELSDATKFITPVGAFLRKTSLDELPQLFNIIKGDMSLVGPRPALYTQENLIRLRAESGANKVRPGLTGLAQINGRDEIPEELKAQYDAQYVEELSAKNDIKILFTTIKKVVKSEDIKH